MDNRLSELNDKYHELSIDNDILKHNLKVRDEVNKKLAIENLELKSKLSLLQADFDGLEEHHRLTHEIISDAQDKSPENGTALLANMDRLKTELAETKALVSGLKCDVAQVNGTLEATVTVAQRYLDQIRELKRSHASALLAKDTIIRNVVESRDGLNDKIVHILGLVQTKLDDIGNNYPEPQTLRLIRKAIAEDGNRAHASLRKLREENSWLMKVNEDHTKVRSGYWKEIIKLKGQLDAWAVCFGSIPHMHKMMERLRSQDDELKAMAVLTYDKNFKIIDLKRRLARALIYLRQVSLERHKAKSWKPYAFETGPMKAERAEIRKRRNIGQFTNS